MEDYDIPGIHDHLANMLQQPKRNGAVISGREDAETSFPLKTWKRKETRQGKEVCYIWVPKS
jgi:hypothetical protein